MSYDPKNLKLIGTAGGGSPLENSPELIKWLGVIMVRWATLDHTLHLFIHTILGHYGMAEAVFIFEKRSVAAVGNHQGTDQRGKLG
jgi:hypothetical protein